MVSRRDGTKDGTNLEWFLREGWYKGVVSMRRMAQMSGFYEGNG